MAQQISVRSHQLNPIERRAFEAVERKGIGHPDSLADLIAETFSNLYSRHCLREFGSIANH
jgi:S-adenosylmethionine synthetase